MIAGPIKDDPDLRGVYIFRTKSADEARGWVMADPAVAAGHFTVEIHPWWSEDVMKKTTTPQKMMTAYLAFLVRGDKWTPEKTPQTEAIQNSSSRDRLAITAHCAASSSFASTRSKRRDSSQQRIRPCKPDGSLYKFTRGSFRKESCRDFLSGEDLRYVLPILRF
jgi:hypothetical protein